MLARTLCLRVRTLSPFGAFLKQTRGKFKGIGGAARAQKLSRAYHALSADAKAKLKVAGGKVRFVRARRVKAVRKVTPYMRFVKAKFPSVMHLPAKRRLAAIGKLWKKARA
jgi:hypothetical protein